MSNVSEISQQLKDIIEANHELQDVWMQGNILEVKPIQNGPLNFTLTDESAKIECVIFDNGTSLRENLPAVGNGVSIKGKIFLRGSISQYKFIVTDINLSSDSLQSQFVSVSTLMEALTNTLEAHSDEVQGEISEVFITGANFTILKLKDATPSQQSTEIIECVVPPKISPSFSLQKGERVHVKGQFGIFSNTSTYRIMIGNENDIKQVIGKVVSGQTTPNECRECHQRFNNLKEQLCATCYDVRRTSEGIVVGAVMRYFNAPRFSNFTSRREYPILLIGTIEGRADVVLHRDSEKRLSAIAECKRIGYDGNDGIDQLKSYLIASETKLGLFADNTNPYEWIFLKKNDERKGFDEISHFQFERELGVDPVSEKPPVQTRLELIRGNIIETKVDAIVNAANAELTRGSGVDAAIRDAGGEEIDRECERILEDEGFCPPGKSVITTGGNLYARHVIHTVGPIWQGGNRSEPVLLADCYKNSLQLAVENGIESIAFPSISTGNYGYPIEEAARVALTAVREFVEQVQQNNGIVPERIQFALFDEEAYACYVNAFSRLGLGLFSLVG